jgi:hypothetical protein
MKNRLKFFLAPVCIVLSLMAHFDLEAQTCNTNAPVSYTLTETSPGEIYIPNASAKPWKGGDTLKIPAKTYSLIEISNFSGDACKKIVIINSGGQVITNTWRMRNDSRYFKITGTGKAGIDYGIKVSGGMLAISLAHHFEIEHVEATGGSLGFYIKAVPDLATPKTVYTTGSATNYVMSDIYLHHNYFHDINGEAMYIGHTGPSGNQEGTGLIPIRLDNVEIAYNVARNIDWDGIQLSNARNAKIHDNSVWNYGRINKGSQQAGIIMGGNTTGEIYNNTISKGTGNGMEVYGYGTIRIHNNTIDSSGDDLTAIGQESFLADDYITTPELNPKQQILFYNNIIRNPKPKGAVRVAGYNNNSLPANLTDNQYYIPNAASNWMFYHVVANPPGSIKTNNVLIGGTFPVPNVAPKANAGADKTITLPVAVLSLTGSGTDTDGSITGYAWSRISGPATGTISAPTAATTTVTSLMQGVYMFELKVTDNAGATGRDTVQVTVSAAVVVPVPGGAGKSIKVNLTNGTSYANSQWNNWNTGTGLTSAKFLYTDATVSAISAVLNSQAMMIDNGANYAAAAAATPGAVLRFNSASTSTRILTIKGLIPSKKYNFEFFGSRASTGNKSVFKIGNVSDTVNTDNNITDVARLNDISADNSGNVTVTVSRVGTWNYIAGFTITEQSAVAVRTTGAPAIMDNTTQAITDSTVTVAATFTHSIKVEINDNSEGSYTITLSDVSGNVIWNKTGTKGIDRLVETIATRQVAVGDYVLKVTTGKGTSVHTITKKIVAVSY